MAETTLCPSCGNHALAHKTISPEYLKIECYNSIEVAGRRGKPISKQCGYMGFLRVAPPR